MIYLAAMQHSRGDSVAAFPGKLLVKISQERKS